MRKIWISYIGVVLWMLVGSACTEDELMKDKGFLGDEEVWVTLDFGHQDFDSIEISTRSTLGEVAESRVTDMYALIFVNDRCVYNKYFGTDAETKKNTVAEVRNATTECWWVQNRTNMTNTAGYTDEDTHGTIRMRTPLMEEGELYLIANANAFTVNISPELLGAIRTKQDLLNLTAKLNGDVVTRYGYFPMVAEVDGVKITQNGITSNNNPVSAELVRLDAKIGVNVIASVGAESSYGSGSSEVKVKVKSFTPESWQVMNVPKGAFIIENEGGNDDVTGYFNTDYYAFESSFNHTHSFSFYMLENRFQVNSTATEENDGSGKYLTNYHQRDQRKKNSLGEYLYALPKADNDEKNIWEFAPENATYLILKGYLAMEPVSGNVEGGTEVGADVTYYIHLGNFGQSTSGNLDALNNYAIQRNTQYTYNITIKGVRNIELEVTSTNNEKQSGATGSIYATQESSLLLDAHYEQFVHTFPVEDVNADAISWYVKTPFGEEGSPKLNDGLVYGDTEYEERLKDFDYKWIWFMVNPMSGNKYVQTMQWYPGNQYRGKADGTEKRLMDIDEFVNYLKVEKRKYDQNKSGIFAPGEVVVTVFVDEYYYEQHPIQGNDSPQDLWKQFVNQPNRLVHILSGNQRSQDKESSITNSSITIRQRSIQTAYNTDRTLEELPTAWGVENLDEYTGLWFFNGNKSSRNSAPTGNYQDFESVTNGRYNTAGMLNLRGGTFTLNNAIDYTLAHPYLKTYYVGSLYTVLLRNRDNNGNGMLDADELRWYVSSLSQLNEIFIGQMGFFNRDAWIYTPETTSQFAATGYLSYSNYHENCVAWRKHLVASTEATILWGEEGTSTSAYLEEFGWSGTKNNGLYSIRCARNLGMNYVSYDEAATKIINEEEQPESLVDYWVGDEAGNRLSGTINTNSIYYFDLSNVNLKSLRPQLSIEALEPTDEFQEHARPYRMFRAGKAITVSGISSSNSSYYQSLKTTYLDKGLVPENGTKGYRIPNVREASLMRLYCSTNWWGSNGRSIVSTFYSNGRLGNDYDYKVTNEAKYSWTFGYNYAQMRTTASNVYREVQDWEP